MKNNKRAALLTVLLLSTASSLLVILLGNTIPLGQASPSYHTTTRSHNTERFVLGTLGGGFAVKPHTTTRSHKTETFAPGTLGGGFAVKPPIGTERLTPASANNSAAALAIASRLQITSVNASKTQAKLKTPCLPGLSRFILPLKEARFTVIKQCVTITGRVVWTHYFNEDGDANFNVILDPPYRNMLGPGSYSKVFAAKYSGIPGAMHVETVCQGPVTSISKENLGACNGYKGPNFKNALPKIGQHVMVTGRYLIEMPEMPGGITELHPVYGIKILKS